jgi:hypothetical protein
MDRLPQPPDLTTLHVPAVESQSMRCESDGHFAEQLFQPALNLQKDYHLCVARGYAQMRQQRVVIAGLARDVGWIAAAMQSRIERMGSCFGDYRVVIYENDSSDDTVAQLVRWQQANPRVSIISESLGDPVHPPARCLTRAARMAYYRTRCQQTIRARYDNYDAVILVDTDLEGGWSYDGVATTFAHHDWDFVGSNGVIVRRRGLRPNELIHYDAWAFRIDPQFTPLPTKQVNRWVFRRGESLQPVTSCFGGLGIYRMQPYLAGAYDGADIEHVGFHRSLLEQGFSKLFINPSQIVLYGRRHRRHDAFFRHAIAWTQWLCRRTPTLWWFANRQTDQRTRRANGPTLFATNNAHVDGPLQTRADDGGDPYGTGPEPTQTNPPMPLPPGSTNPAPHRHAA